ncbi:MAG: aquaporin, partial [Candidatus Nanopelagicales bacterium]
MTKTVRQIFFESLGTYILLLAIVGSGVMATNLTDNIALALLINAAAIGATLFVLISVLDNLSGAYFNPVVVLYALIRKKMS